MPRKAVDLTGKTFGAWTVLGRDEDESRLRGETYYVCRCSCGIVATVRGWSLKVRRSSRCQECIGRGYAEKVAPMVCTACSKPRRAGAFITATGERFSECRRCRERNARETRRRAAPRASAMATEIEAALGLDGMPDNVSTVGLPARPKTRGECRPNGPGESRPNGCRPCPWAGCRHHLAITVSPVGTITARPGMALENMAETCALDVADRGAHKQAEVAVALGVTRARVDHIEAGLRRNRSLPLLLDGYRDHHLATERHPLAISGGEEAQALPHAIRRRSRATTEQLPSLSRQSAKYWTTATRALGGKAHSAFLRAVFDVYRERSDERAKQVAADAARAAEAEAKAEAAE